MGGRVGAGRARLAGAVVASMLLVAGVGMMLGGIAGAVADLGPSTASLQAGSTLEPGQSLVARGGRYRLVMQTDGNLVLYWLSQAVWADGTAGHKGAVARMQTDGNFVVYAGTRALWASGTGGHKASAFVLTLLSDGDFVIESPGSSHSQIWSSRTETTRLRIVPAASPAWNADAPDPFVMRLGSAYYAFTTGTVLGNHIQVLESTNPTSGWHPFSHPYGDSALPNPPGWETSNTQTSPSVIETGGHFVMFYDASENPHPAATGYDCLSVATASTITPSHPVFTDSSRGPLVCDPGVGVLDPSGFVDAANHRAYLLWKSNDGASTQASHVWVRELDAAGTGFAAGSSARVILTNDTARFPWETTLDDPDLVAANGRYFLAFSVGSWESAGYAEAFALCSGPLGPCSQPAGGPFLSSYSGASGPGGASLFADGAGNWWIDYAAWAPSCTSYRCGGARRFFVAPIDLGGNGG